MTPEEPAAGRSTAANRPHTDTITAHVPPRPTTVPAPSLVYWRMQRGVIQTQLADLAGVDRATIQRLEAGGEARLTTISKLAAALDVSPADLQRQPPAN